MRFALSTLALAAAATVGSAASAAHIDFISDGGFAPVAASSEFGPVTASQGGDAGNILGGQRDIILTPDAVNEGIITAGTIGAVPNDGPVTDENNPGRLLFDTSTGTFGTLEIIYDGVGTAGLGGLDFSAWVGIAIDLTDLDGMGDLSIRLNDINGQNATVTQSAAAIGTYTFLFADYGSVDITQIDAVSVKINSTELASDFEIASIVRVVPEPATAALAALGLGAATLRRRRNA